jgi:hemoglobin-like flavoprotein
MDPESLHAIRRSFARLEAQGHVAALIFYQRLFAVAPQVRPLFQTDIESQSRKLLWMLSELISIAEKPEAFRATLHQLGARHVQYGARPEHYPVVVQCLLEMMAEVLGPEFTQSLRVQWASLLQTVAAIMLEGAARATTQSAA